MSDIVNTTGFKVGMVVLALVVIVSIVVGVYYGLRDKKDSGDGGGSDDPGSAGGGGDPFGDSTMEFESKIDLLNSYYLSWLTYDRTNDYGTYTQVKPGDGTTTTRLFHVDGDNNIKSFPASTLDLNDNTTDLYFGNEILVGYEHSKDQFAWWVFDPSKESFSGRYRYTSRDHLTPLDLWVEDNGTQILLCKRNIRKDKYYQPHILIYDKKKNSWSEQTVENAEFSKHSAILAGGFTADAGFYVTDGASQLQRWARKDANTWVSDSSKVELFSETYVQSTLSVNKHTKNCLLSYQRTAEKDSKTLYYNISGAMPEPEDVAVIKWPTSNPGETSNSVSGHWVSGLADLNIIGTTRENKAGVQECSLYLKVASGYPDGTTAFQQLTLDRVNRGLSDATVFKLQYKADKSTALLLIPTSDDSHSGTLSVYKRVAVS